MKKLLMLCLCLACILNLSGCAVGDLIDQFTDIHGDNDAEHAPAKTRVYMDELKGTLTGFSGNTLTLLCEENSYLFDVSEAMLECQNGMITGDEVSVIYEGKLPDSGTDTSSVKALKVVNDYHNQQPLQEQVLTGTLQNLTANTITVLDAAGYSITYPITGSELCFYGGVRRDAPVYLHCYGQAILPEDSASKNITASNIKVLSVSDQEPLAAPDLTADPKPETAKLRVSIQNVTLDTMNVLLSDQTTSMVVSLSDCPVYFQGGPSSGTRLDLTYSGSFNGTSSSGMYLHSIYSEGPKKNREITSTVSGIVMARTANTLTLQTSDGATVTFRPEIHTDAPDAPVISPEIGSGIRITFDPEVNKTSNIYTCIKIEES